METYHFLLAFNLLVVVLILLNLVIRYRNSGNQPSSGLFHRFLEIDQLVVLLQSLVIALLTFSVAWFSPDLKSSNAGRLILGFTGVFLLINTFIIKNRRYE